MGIKIGEKYGCLTAIKQVERPAHIKAVVDTFFFVVTAEMKKLLEELLSVQV